MKKSIPKSIDFLAFSLIELLISLIVISCITAAFTPVITKKLKTSAVSLNAASSEITTECSTKFSSSCKLCTKSYCIQCELSNCEIGKYTENKTCSCKDCSSLFSDCLECDNTKCTKCKQTHYVKEGKCEICPTDKICDGVNARDEAYCSSPDPGYFCRGAEIKQCALEYNSNCATCDSSQCRSCTGGFYLSGTKCERCADGACVVCKQDGITCTKCLNNVILNTNTGKCDKSCSSAMEHCLMCTDASTCTQCASGFYINANNKCSSCGEISNCTACINKSVCTQCASGYYVNTSDTCSECKVLNCASCNKDGTCLACNQGYHVSSDKKTCEANDGNFSCSDSNFMRIGNLCVTRKNMGDSSTLSIPDTITVVKANGEFCYPHNQKCCWIGEMIPSNFCDSNHGGYSGCSRTLCDWRAASEICAKFNYGGKTWRLPTSSELANWGVNSVGLDSNGLMLCDWYEGYGSARCAEWGSCKGGGYCFVRGVWNKDSTKLESMTYSLFGGVWKMGKDKKTSALSVRCVTEME